MYYHGREDPRVRRELRIGLPEASAEDPFTWTKHPGNPVLAHAAGTAYVLAELRTDGTASR